MSDYDYNIHFQHAELDGYNIYYFDSGGSSPPVIFLHAASGNSSLWEKQYAPFTTRGYRFIAFDRSGYGHSTRTGSPDIGERPELELLIDYLGVERFHLVGVAAGGGVALEYSLERHQRVRSLVLANSIGNVQDPDYVKLGQRLRPASFYNLPVELRELGPSYRGESPEGVQRWLELSKQGQAVVLNTHRPGNSKAAQVVTYSAMEKMKLPVLLLTGDADLYMPPSVLRSFKQHLPGAEIAIIPESGHASYWENPEVFNRLVLDFLDRH